MKISARFRARHAAIIVSLATLSFSPARGATASPAGGASLGWVRRGVYLFQGATGDVARLEYQPAPGWDDELYLEAPDGRRDAPIALPHGTSGTLELTLHAGSGTYRLVVAPGHRYRLSVPSGHLIFVPEEPFTAFFERSGEGGPYVFRVPGGGPFTLHATNQNDFEGSAGHVTLTDPAGHEAGTLKFDDFDEAALWKRLGATRASAAERTTHADTARVPEFRLLSDSIVVASPAAGFWKVDAGIDGLRADDIGFWLTGVPNIVAPSESAWFAPDLVQAQVTIHAEPDSVLGPAGEIGAVWDWPSHHAEASKVFRDMGLRGDVHYLPQATIEPVNDDADPNHIRLEGFHFDEYAWRMGPPSSDSLNLTSLMALTRPAKWLNGHADEFAEFAEAAVGYHDALPGVDPAHLYWQVGNEPNQDLHLEDYLKLYKAVGERLRASSAPRVKAAKLGGPALGNAQHETSVLDFNWIESLLKEDAPYVDFVVWNEYRLPLIEDTWQFGDLVRKTRELTRRYAVGGRLPEIVIGATNMRGGIVLENDKQDGFYGASWWASAVASALGTGDVRLMNYFYLIDEGSRRKGLLFPDGRWKPVARMTALLARSIHGEVIFSRSDHSGVEVIATRSRDAAGASQPGGAGPAAVAWDRLDIVVVNTMEREVALAPLTFQVPASWKAPLREETRRYAPTDSEPLLIPPAAMTTAGGTVEIRATLPARAVVVFTLRPGS